MRTHSRRTFSALLGAGIAGAQSRKANVVFILTDDQRQDTIRALGNPHIVTPNLDALVRSGTTLMNAYCMGGHSAAVCLPSRMMIQRGNSWFRVTREKIAQPNLAETFKLGGYATYAFSKRGNVDNDAQSYYEFRDVPLPDDQTDRMAGEPGKQMADCAIRFLTGWKQKKNRPFLMYLAGAAPHDPRVAAKAYLARYDAEKIPLPKNYLPLHPFDNGELKIRDEALAPWPRTPERVQQELRDYYAVITQMDEQIGRIVQAVKDAGEFNNTYFVFTSDQGLAMGSHGLMGKQNLYEHSMRAGLLVAGPGIAKNRRVNDFAYLFDIYPTLCELTGTPGPTGIEGRSLAPLLLGKKYEGRDTIFLGYRDVQRAVRQGRWKLIVYPKVNRVQLFDLEADPFEVTDLSAKPDQGARVAELKALMRKQQELYGDKIALESERPGKAEVDASFFGPSPN